ncbi:hypothetical protein ACWCOP_03890 [Maricaulaceae bacterium MS644]
MVEIKDEQRPSPRKADWAALYERWRIGETPEDLALAYGLAPSNVRERCRWVERMFPPDAPARLRHRFARRLMAAEAALDAGSPLEAERRAKALVALVRAARALENWSEPQNAAAAEAEESGGEPFDAGAELERRLLAQIRGERREALRAPADAGAKAGRAGEPESLAEGGTA